jgi:hypothetical protein
MDGDLCSSILETADQLRISLYDTTGGGKGRCTAILGQRRYQALHPIYCLGGQDAIPF